MKNRDKSVVVRFAGEDALSSCRKRLRRRRRHVSFWGGTREGLTVQKESPDAESSRSSCPSLQARIDGSGADDERSRAIEDKGCKFLR